MKQLTRTVSQVREIEEAQLGHKGIPNADWPLAAGNDCLKFQLVSLGVVTRSDMSDPAISIRAFLATTRGSGCPANLRAGDLVLQQWDDLPDVDHVGFLYSKPTGALRTIEANTSPKPGVALTKANRGIYDKTRPIGSWVVGGIRPPYVPEAAIVTSSKRPRSASSSGGSTRSSRSTSPAPVPARTPATVPATASWARRVARGAGVGRPRRPLPVAAVRRRTASPPAGRSSPTPKR
jgi:hypothetical protein